MSYETPVQPPVQPATVSTPPKPSPLAIISLCLGVVSIPLIFVCIGWLTAISGLIIGIIALVNINNSNGSLKGKGLAIGGLITSVLAIIIYGGFIAYIATSSASKSGNSEFSSMIQKSIEEANARQSTNTLPEAETEEAPVEVIEENEN